MTNLYEKMLVVMNLLLIFLKVLYYIGESIYRLFVPARPKNVAGEIVLITGTARGIGKELALKYASLGATVVCWDINTKANEETVNEIKNMGAATAYAYKCNVGDRDEVFQVAERVKRDVGNVTILVNNAGIIAYLPFMDYKPEQLKQIFDVNILAHFWTTQAFLPSMLENDHGHVVAICSIAGGFTTSYMIPYCATKFAVRGFMRALADEVALSTNKKGSNVKFTTILPSLTNTKTIEIVDTNKLRIFQIYDVQRVVHETVYAQRQNYIEHGIPTLLLYLSNMAWCLPYKGYSYIRLMISQHLAESALAWAPGEYMPHS